MNALSLTRLALVSLGLAPAAAAAALALANIASVPAAPPARAEAIGPKGDGDRVRAFVGADPGSVEVAPAPTAARKAALAASTALPLDALGGLRVYHVPPAEQADGPRPTVVALVDAQWGARPVRIGVAIGSKGGVQSVRAFDDADREVAELAPFLAQFAGRFGLRLGEASARPIGDAIRMRDGILGAAEPPRAPEELARWTLLRHRLMMWECERAAIAFQAARQKGAPLEPELRALDERLAALDEFSSHVRSVLSPKDLGRYRAFITAMREGIGRAREEVGKDADRGAKVATAEVKQGCGSCHGWDGNQWRQPLQSAWRERRQARGIEDGVFVADFDVRRFDMSQQDAQALAGAVKAALLEATE